MWTSIPLAIILAVQAVLGDITIDLSKAEQDPDTGNFCVVQKVCITNPPADLTEAGCEKKPQLDERCDCDPYIPDPNSQCPRGNQCIDCQCLDSRCDCNPDSPDPDSQCPAGNSCVDCQCLDASCDCNPDSPNPDSQCPAQQSCIDCNCLDPRCTCNPNSPNPDSQCPRGSSCVDCECLDSQCDCNPNSPDPNSQCSAGNKCVECQCLDERCDCNPDSADANTQCPGEDICVGCVCQDPKCECDVGSDNPDMQCPGNERCVGCVCQDCPQSARSGSNAKPFNPPLVFVIDTTKSVKPDKDSIFNLTSKLVNRIAEEKINIPRFQLVTFNDFGPAINRNVRLEIDTDNVRDFGRKTANLQFESYDGGRDSKERLTQGLLVALQNSSPRSLILVFTDNGSKDLKLKKEIIRLKKEKQSEVFIVLTPDYEGRLGDKSITTYQEISEVFRIADVGSDSFLGAVNKFETENCV